MHIEDYRNYCLSLKGTSESLPFDEKILVFKVMGKIFTLTNIELFEQINVKCDPEYAIELREKYDGVLPGYHMSKKHWNTVLINHDVSDKQIYEWVKDSYDLVVEKLTKKQKEELSKLH